MARVVSLLGALLAVTAFAASVALKPYPGAKVDEKASQAASAMLIAFGDNAENLKATVYMTNDSYEKVTAYYLAKGKEFGPPAGKKKEYMKLPSGEPIMEMYVILDGAADIMASNSWVKIQRPYVGAIGMVDGKQVAEDVRNVTAIVTVGPK